MKPVFIAKSVVDTGYSKLLKEQQHIRFVLKQSHSTLTGIGFNMARKISPAAAAGTYPLDIVFTLDENEWNGQTTLQLKVIDFNISKQAQ